MEGENPVCNWGRIASVALSKSRVVWDCSSKWVSQTVRKIVKRETIEASRAGVKSASWSGIGSSGFRKLGALSYMAV
ncbi:hypothetical protein G9A89_013052 [Geosiphon pyriformis]|nr:hypothetical protein G9A89_013052 [Geosiphon pyriformis]